MKTTFIFLLLMISINSFGQTEGNKNMDVQMTREAYFPKGDKELYTYIFQNLKYSEEAKQAKASGEILIAFFVETDSTLTSFKVITDVGYGVSDNLKAVLKDLKYVPALVNGVPMRSKVMISVPVRAR